MSWSNDQPCHVNMVGDGNLFLQVWSLEGQRVDYDRKSDKVGIGDQFYSRECG